MTVVTALEAGDSPSELLCGVYEHYKSTTERPAYYLVLGVGRHTKTEEALVAYVPLYPAGGPRLAFRPLDEFMGDVTVDGTARRRFTYVGVEIPGLSV